MKGFLAALVLVALAFATTAAYQTINSDWVIYRRAERIAGTGSFADAIPVYKTLSERNFGGGGEVKFRLAGLYEKRGDYASAAAIYGDLLKVEPGNRALRIRLARNLTALGRYDEAIAAYRTILGEH